MIPDIKFSVVMAVYKNDNIDHLHIALNSIVNQSFPPSEIIISIDGPIDIDFDLFFDNYKIEIPLKFIKNNINRGPGFARHAAIISASYDLIGIMDSDDISLPSRFELQIRFMRLHKLDVVGSFINEFDISPEDANRVREVPLTHGKILKFCKWRCPMNHVTVIFKKSAYLNAGGYPFTRVAEDHELFYRMLTSGAHFGNINEILVHVRCGFNLLTRRRGLSYLSSELPFLKRMYNNGFLNLFEFFTNIVIRVFARLLSRTFLSSLYKFFLRKHY
jgi:glycosyltransferase involved in cell wall biosynthesis